MCLWGCVFQLITQRVHLLTPLSFHQQKPTNVLRSSIIFSSSSKLMYKPMTKEEIDYNEHIQSRRPAIMSASARLQAIVGMPNPAPYNAPQPSQTLPTPPPSALLNSTTSNHPDGTEDELQRNFNPEYTRYKYLLPFTPGQGLLARLESYLDRCRFTYINPSSLSFHSAEVDHNSGLLMDWLLLKMHANEMNVLRLYEVDLTDVDVSDGGGCHWMWIVMQKKNTELATNVEEGYNLNKGGALGNPLCMQSGWTAFGCPSYGVCKLEENISSVKGYAYGE